MSNICLFYHPEAYSTAGPKLMGRNAAGESFLRGYLTHGTSSEFCVQVVNPEHANHFGQIAIEFGRAEAVKSVTKASLGNLIQSGVVYYPGPDICKQAFLRAAYGHGSWSLCGVTHTTSSASAMDAIADLLTYPVQSWDALICTSTAVKDNVTQLLQAQADYLKDRLGITKFVLPLMPVIPLGIHAADFKYSEVQKTSAKLTLGVNDQTLVVLYTGRLSFHAKAHPLAMYQALEAAIQATGKKVVLVECGWHANEFIEKAYAEAAKAACPSVRVVTLDGRKAEDRQTAWASADVFCSLSDNIQETFGIVPIEAMAAGLPVVVSDWDGYKDTVRDGIDGFRIPTLMPQAGLGGDLALRHALEIDTYDMYCGHGSSLVAVDIQATTEAFIKLLNSSELRKQMGDSGLRRVQEVYDWSVVIPQYEALWAKQTEIRLAQGKELKPLAHPWPARMDPFHSFASYPTRALTAETMLSLVGDRDQALQRLKDLMQLRMVDYAKVVLPTEAEIKAVLAEASAGDKTALAMIASIQDSRKAFVLRSLAWLVKVGVLKVIA